MNIKKKLLYYGFGVCLGIIAVNVFWDSKDQRSTYFPSSRIVYDISKKELFFSEKSNQQINSFSISKKTIIEQLANGDFSGSLLDRDAKPCKTYSLTSIFNENNYDFTFQNCDSTATLLNIALK